MIDELGSELAVKMIDKLDSELAVKMKDCELAVKMFDKLDSELEVKMIDKLSPNTPAWNTSNFCVMIRPLVTWTVSETMLLYMLVSRGSHFLCRSVCD